MRCKWEFRVSAGRPPLDAVSVVGAASAQQLFRIGTGGTAGTYYPVGGMSANAVSQPGKIVAAARALFGKAA